MIFDVIQQQNEDRVPEQDPARFKRTVLDFFDKPFAMPDTKGLGWFD